MAIADSLAALKADVAAETSVETSAVTLIQGLAAQIVALKNSTTDSDTAAALDALAAQITQSSAALAAAVSANTPAPTA